MNKVAIILFGMSGDLAKRKLIPALYALLMQSKARSFVIIGIGLEPISCGEILEHAKSFVKQHDEQSWRLFCSCCRYQPMDVRNPQEYQKLAELVTNLEAEYHLSGNRLVYCATTADFFCPITEYCAQANIIKNMKPDETPWFRVVYEKPFGHDESSAHAINQCIGKYLDESQIYRIDHYLTEEMVSNIALVRFANCIFEPLWNGDFIKEVYITLNEELCLEGRGLLYDKQGALRDMIQNHALEILALVAMEAPDCLTGECIRLERANVLKQVAAVNAVLGQYNGYRNEQGVDKDSQTETFAAITVRIHNKRWQDVSFYLQSGKCLSKKESSINIVFKKRGCPFMKSERTRPNELILALLPEQSFSVRLNAKKPGTQQELVPVTMNYCHSCNYKEEMHNAYEILIKSVLRGEQSVSVGLDEIEYAWRVIDTIKKMQVPLIAYAQGSLGPDISALFETQMKETA